MFWELELAQAESDMDELLTMQKTEANSAFCQIRQENYEKVDYRRRAPLDEP